MVLGGIVGAGGLPLPGDDRPASVSTVQAVHYRDCDAARAAGVASLHRGDNGYEPRLDADNDGIACEPLPRR